MISRIASVAGILLFNGFCPVGAVPLAKESLITNTVTFFMDGNGNRATGQPVPSESLPSETNSPDSSPVCPVALHTMSVFTSSKVEAMADAQPEFSAVMPLHIRLNSEDSQVAQLFPTEIIMDSYKARWVSGLPALPGMVPVTELVGKESVQVGFLNYLRQVFGSRQAAPRSR